MEAEAAKEQEKVQPEEAEKDVFEEVDKLQDFGINQSDIKKLKEAGIFTISGIMMRTRTKLQDIRGLSEAKVAKLIEVASKVQRVHDSTQMWL